MSRQRTVSLRLKRFGRPRRNSDTRLTTLVASEVVTCEKIRGKPLFNAHCLGAWLAALHRVPPSMYSTSKPHAGLTGPRTLVRYIRRSRKTQAAMRDLDHRMTNTTQDTDDFVHRASLLVNTVCYKVWLGPVVDFERRPMPSCDSE